MILCAAAAAIDDTITAVHTTSTLRFCLHAWFDLHVCFIYTFAILRLILLLFYCAFSGWFAILVLCLWLFFYAFLGDFSSVYGMFLFFQVCFPGDFSSVPRAVPVSDCAARAVPVSECAASCFCLHKILSVLRAVPVFNYIIFRCDSIWAVIMRAVPVFNYIIFRCDSTLWFLWAIFHVCCKLSLSSMLLPAFKAVPVFDC